MTHKSQTHHKTRWAQLPIERVSYTLYFALFVVDVDQAMTAVRQKFMSFLPGVGCGILLSALLSTYLLDLHPTSHSPLVTNHHALVSRDTTDDAQKDDGVRFCYPPLDSQLLQQHDINSTAFSSANSWMDTFLSSFINPKPNGTGTDSIAAAVVLPGGTVYAKGFGTLKANDSSSGGNVTADTLYRMASVTKVMTALEAFVLDQQGKLSMEGDITEYLPNFKFPSGNNATWRIKLGLDPASNSSDDSAGKRKITPLQLASEMAGLLRDEPVDQPWPLQLGQNIPVQVKMWVNGTAEQVLTSIGDSPADTGSWTYPIYSNMGFNLLGLVTAAADGGKLGYEDLLQQDIFGPLGMNSSFFKVPDARVAELAVSSLNSNWSDTDVGAHNPAGGLYSSATDLARFMRSLLNPSPTKSSDGLPSNFVLDSYGVRKWLSPLLRLDDDLTVVGAPWEMKSYMDTPSSGVNASNSRTTTLYTKAGDFPGYINLMVIDPAREFAFVILTTGVMSILPYFLKQS